MQATRTATRTATAMVTPMTIHTLQARTRAILASGSHELGYTSTWAWQSARALAELCFILKRMPPSPLEFGRRTVWILTLPHSLLADALHALTDLLSDITTLATISYSLRPATPGFPMGYGKIESIGALAVSGILLAGGVGIGLQAVMALSQQFFPEIFGVLSHVLENVPIHSHSHGHGHGHDHDVHIGPSIHAAWLAAGSILIKEWLYRATMKVAKEKRSSVLSSNVSSKSTGNCLQALY